MILISFKGMIFLMMMEIMCDLSNGFWNNLLDPFINSTLKRRQMGRVGQVSSAVERINTLSHEIEFVSSAAVSPWHKAGTGIWLKTTGNYWPVLAEKLGKCSDGDHIISIAHILHFVLGVHCLVPLWPQVLQRKRQLWQGCVLSLWNTDLSQV